MNLGPLGPLVSDPSGNIEQSDFLKQPAGQDHAGECLAGKDVVRLSGHVEGPKGAALFRRACAMGLEGIVSKRIDARYRSEPFLGWRKIKCPGYARP